MSTPQLAGYGGRAAAAAFRIHPIPYEAEVLLQPFIEDLAVNTDPAARLQDVKTIAELILAYEAAHPARRVCDLYVGFCW